MDGVFYEVVDLVVALGGDGDDAAAAGSDLLVCWMWGTRQIQNPSSRQFYRRRVGYRTANRLIVLRVILEESE